MDTQNLTTLAIFLVAVGALFWWKRPDISSARARQLVAEGARLIDVRSPNEYAGRHIEKARNIPVGEIARRAPELGAKDQPVIVYCASGTRSAMAKRTLKSAGFTQVYNLGSISNW